MSELPSDSGEKDMQTNPSPQEVKIREASEDVTRKTGAALLDAVAVHKRGEDSWAALDMAHAEKLKAFKEAGGSLRDGGYAEDGEPSVTYIVPTAEKGQEQTNDLRAAIEAKHRLTEAGENPKKAARKFFREEAKYNGQGGISARFAARKIVRQADRDRAA